MIGFACPDCGKKFKVEDKAAGRKAICPDCGKKFQIPTPKPKAPTPPVPKKSQLVVEEQPPVPIKRREVVSTEVIQAAPVSAVQVNVAQPSKAAHSLGIASVILGILAFLICWIPLIGLVGIPLSGLGLLLGIVGIVLAAIRRDHGIGFPIAVTAISLLAIVITLSMTLVIGTAVTAVGTVAEQALEEAAQDLDDIDQPEKPPVATPVVEKVEAPVVEQVAEPVVEPIRLPPNKFNRSRRHPPGRVDQAECRRARSGSEGVSEFEWETGWETALLCSTNSSDS